LRAALLRPGSLWRGLRVLEETGSTNADLIAVARAGADEGEIITAERQVTGRGRLGRSWVSPARAGIACSVLLRPTRPNQQRGWPAAGAHRIGWLPLLTGVALMVVIRRLGQVEAWLKWPNDVLVGAGRDKCAGILTEALPDLGVVVGFGVNVTLRRDELPRPDSTSLALAGAQCVDRTLLLTEMLQELAARYAAWRSNPDGEELRVEYRRCCDTLGRQVQIILPSGQSLRGEAVDVDVDGRLVVAEASGRQVAVAAGDVIHVR